jgi:hypothetical protein
MARFATLIGSHAIQQANFSSLHRRDASLHGIDATFFWRQVGNMEAERSANRACRLADAG